MTPTLTYRPAVFICSWLIVLGSRGQRIRGHAQSLQHSSGDRYFTGRKLVNQPV